MARYTGPKAKISRKFNEPILGPCKPLQKKGYGPGVHGKKPGKRSAYAWQLMAKQKIRYLYGVQERQLRNLFSEAVARKGVTGDILLQLLERRLDNTVYRLGIASTRRAARQLVSHKHIMVNGRSINIPSYRLKAGDIIHLHPSSQELTTIKASVEHQRPKYAWLAWDAQKMTGRFINIPERKAIPENIQEQNVVEFYSK